MQQSPKTTLVCFISTVLFAGIGTIGYCQTPKDIKEAVNRVENSVDSKKIKSKFHEAADSLDKENVNAAIDRIADSLDKDKLKEKIDELADYLDKDKIKDWIDSVAEYLDKDKLKEVIDIVAEALDREKIKDAVDQVIASVDKERIKETFDQSVDQIAASLQEVTHSLEDELRQVGNNPSSIRTAVEKYNWNRYLPDRANYGPATLSGLKLAGGKKAVIARPGELIEGEVVCSLDRDQCSALSLYRVVLGIKNQGGQTTIFNHFGLRAGKETDRFTLTAPSTEGSIR